MGREALIENGIPYPMDVSAGEDLCRVPHPVSATVLGIMRRVVQGEYRDWARRQQHKRHRTFPTFRDKMGRRGHRVLRVLCGTQNRL